MKKTTTLVVSVGIFAFSIQNTNADDVIRVARLTPEKTVGADTIKPLMTNNISSLKIDQLKFDKITTEITGATSSSPVTKGPKIPWDKMDFDSRYEAWNGSGRDTFTFSFKSIGQ